MLMHLTRGTIIHNAYTYFLNRQESRELPCPNMQIYRHCCISRISDCYVNATDCGPNKRGGGRNFMKHNELKILRSATSAENQTDRTAEKTIQQCAVHTCTHAQNTPTLRVKFPTSNERSYLALGPSCSTAVIKWCSSILTCLIFFSSMRTYRTERESRKFPLRL